MSRFFLFLVLFVSSFVVYAGDSSRIGPDARVILLYEDGGEVVVKECRDYTWLGVDPGAWRSDCERKVGTMVRRVLVSEFADALRMSLRVPFGSYDEETARKVAMYNLAGRGGVLGSVERRAELRLEIEEIERFHKRYGEGNNGLERLAELRRELEGLEEPVQVVEEIEGEIRGFVSKTVEVGRLHEMLYSEEGGGVIFNALGAFLKTPVLSFKYLAPGEFMMGSPLDEEGRQSDEGNARGQVRAEVMRL